jgi:small subunit ribosomal protein S5
MPRPAQDKPKNDYPQKLIDLARVARVVSGGRRFSFRATLVAGNNKGEVGVGLGKAGDTAKSIGKAFNDARKNAIQIPLTKHNSIPHEVTAKYGSARIVLKPAKEGKGLVAGGAVRIVLMYGGVENASAKILSHSKNKLNNARATIEALKMLKTNKTQK